MDRAQEAAQLVREWEMRIAAIPNATREGWIDHLIGTAGNEMNLILVKLAIGKIADQVHANPKRKKPNFHDLEIKYSELAADQRRREVKPENLIHCETCGDRGLLHIIKAWSRQKQRYVPLRRNQTCTDDGDAYEQIIPCSCPSGRSFNDRFFNYTPEMVERLILHCAYATPTQAFSALVSVLALKHPNMRRYHGAPNMGAFGTNLELMQPKIT